MSTLATQEMDLAARRGWSGNSNHSIQNHTAEELSQRKMPEEEEGKKKNNGLTIRQKM